MRLYEGAPRHNYEDVLRSIGAVLDQRGLRDMTLVELDDGFVVQGLALVPGTGGTWTDTEARLEKETVQLLGDDVADDGRGRRPAPPARQA